MNDSTLTQEERILQVMRQVLTRVAKETYTRPGHRHPLSDDTVDDIRHCLGLITARESELHAAAGRERNARPRFIDEPQSSVVVPLTVPGAKDKDKDKDK
jgi:DNA uptake protein ComE-like DNA-binding protein